MKKCQRVLKTGRQVHVAKIIDTYKEKHCIYNLNSVKHSFFFYIIAKNNNVCFLFSTLDRLTKLLLSAASELPSKMNFPPSSMTMIIRQCLHVFTSDQFKYHDNFIQSTIKICRTLQHLTFSPCWVDIVPIGFFKNTNCMASDLPQIIKMSLLLGFFPQAWKTTIIKPLLKGHLETLLMNNYSFISNNLF